MPLKNRLVRYTQCHVADVFEKEHSLLKQVQSEALSQALLLWQAKTPTLVLPAGNKWPTTPTLSKGLEAIGWELVSRKTGGAPVPQLPGIINVSHIYHWDETSPYDIHLAYQRFCLALTHFLASFGLKAEIHATPNSYCDGDYNLNINDKKIVGTAQRVLLKKCGGKVVLAQACIIIDTMIDTLVAPVIYCNQECGHNTLIEANAHTALFDHIETRPNSDALFQALTNSFLKTQK